MTMTYHDGTDGKKPPRTVVAKGWMLLNAVIALGMAVYWSGLAVYVDEPFKWAMRASVGSHPDLFEYPYLTLWLTPLLCMIGGWAALRAHQPRVARLVGSYPTFMLVVMMGWYYVAPIHWH